MNRRKRSTTAGAARASDREDFSPPEAMSPAPGGQKAGGSDDKHVVDLLAVVAHEIKSPLTGMLGVSQVLRRRLARLTKNDDQSTEALREALTMAQNMLLRIEVQGDRLMRMTDDLLDVTHIQANELMLHYSEFDLPELMRECVDDLASAWPARSIRVEVSSNDMPVVADADRVRQVIDNYVTNALRYSAPTQPVVASLTPSGATALVRVRDRGPGLTLEQQASLWDRYKRVTGVRIEDDSHGATGLGLGLFLSRAIVEQHGGSVGIESAPGQGATFWFTLPLAREVPRA